MRFRTDYSPNSAVFSKMSKRDLREYFQLFLENLQPCIADLTACMHRSENYKGWIPNFQRDSLTELGQWLATRLETRPLTPEEIEEVEKSLKHPMDFPKKTYTQESLSLIVMAGMYFGEMFVKNFPGLKWELNLSRKNNADYGQAVISGFKHYPMNPVRILSVFASRHAFGDKEENKARSLNHSYDAWVRNISST